MFSCSSKSYIYFYENPENKTDTISYNPVRTHYIVRPNDILYIDFFSALTDAEKFFSYSSHNSGGNMQVSPSVMYVSEYVVSDSGLLKIPVIGNLDVSGLSISDIERLLEFEGRKYINDVVVKVKLLSYKITFLGEFGQPGEKYFYSDKVSLVDALAAAGEVTFYGDRKNVRVMRQTDNGIQSFRLDLNDASLLNSQHFYLKPNDILYAEPLPRKFLKLQTADYTILLVTLTSTLTLISLIISRK